MSYTPPSSIVCTANHNFKISTPECIRCPPNCAVSRVSNEKKIFWEGHSPIYNPIPRRFLHWRPSPHPAPVWASILASSAFVVWYSSPKLSNHTLPMRQGRVVCSRSDYSPSTCCVILSGFRFVLLEIILFQSVQYKQRQRFAWQRLG